jgi:hypothetical protein
VIEHPFCMISSGTSPRATHEPSLDILRSQSFASVGILALIAPPLFAAIVAFERSSLNAKV